jgi:hypothetical protein
MTKRNNFIYFLITLLVFILLIIIYRNRKIIYGSLEKFTQSGNDTLTKITEKFLLLKESINSNILQQIPNREGYVFTDNYPKLDEIFINTINNNISNLYLSVSLDRNIYDIYIKNSDIIFSASVILKDTNQYNISGKFFINVYGKIIDDKLTILFIEENKKHIQLYEFNNENIPLPREIDLYEKDLNLLLSSVEGINKVNSIPDYKSLFRKFPYHTKFELDEFLKSVLLEEINKSVIDNDYFKNDNLQSIRALYNIYYLDSNSDRDYIFGFDLLNATRGFTLQLIVYIRIPNITNFLMDDGTFVPKINSFIKKENVEILRLEKLHQKVNIKITSPNQDYNTINYYKLNQGDYGFDITEQMRIDFDKKIKGITGFDSLGFCYDSDTTYGLTSIENKEECIDNGGIWDYPPNLNSDCPFYGANKNYPNQYGKLLGNACQLPMNMRLIGNRFYSNDEKYAPMCYNCKNNLVGNGSLGFCCNEQIDTKLYPNLLTPDYAFNGDTAQRILHKSYFDRSKLKTL